MTLSDLTSDIRVLWRMLLGQPRVGSHAERLQKFYAPQADRYDAFRARLLHGRQEVIDLLNITEGSHVVELGCGTGSSLDFLGEKVKHVKRFEMIDLCPALIDKARQRAAGHSMVQVIEADAAQWQSTHPVDFILISYALTMIPQWSQVLQNAKNMLSPSGRIGIVDFHLPASANKLGNLIWKRWFRHDGVHLSELHLPLLRTLFDETFVSERRARVPYLPRVHAPYYLFVGKALPQTTQHPISND
jgi:S-adenosylmethionine-diacylgycerolhomoserine-N-methlytransferase